MTDLATKIKIMQAALDGKGIEAICARMSANNKYEFHRNHGVKNEKK